MDGKDNNNPKLLEDVFSSGAIVTLEIKTPTIKFPLEIHGNKNIAKLLFYDFHKKFDQVKSYYLSDDFQALSENRILGQKWLVMMREKATEYTYVGAGHYDWFFENVTGARWSVRQLHVVIHDMVSFPENNTKWLQTFQFSAIYPWLDIGAAITAFEMKDELIPISSYLIKHAEHVNHSA